MGLGLFYNAAEPTRCCAQSDYGYIGCTADVLDVMDSACSGRRRCDVAVPSAELERAAAVACPGDLKLYLTATYRCLPGKHRHVDKHPFAISPFLPPRCRKRNRFSFCAPFYPPPLAVSCFSEIQIGFTFLVPAHPGSPGKRAAKRVCVHLFSI